MALDAGSKLGQYEIIGVLGAGGMGQVYRARDTKLGRDVAIKVILEAFIADRERLARFEREARTLAALNHPNVATLYGKEESSGQHFLVMEFVDGLTLAERLARGPLPLDQAVAFARQIAEGLEAAHEKGIVHRDLKPANIKITADDKVKVLDFGLATAADPASKDAGLYSSIANSPTVTSLGTQAGMILGTASYMSPEQARGMVADHRSDVFSFGVVLCEMLTGRQPFPGETVSDVLASVLARDPDLSSLPPDLAPRLTDLVKRCLEKHPRKRWQAIGEVRHELEQIAVNPRKSNDAAVVAATAAALLQPKPMWRRLLPIVLVAIAASGITLAIVTFTRPAPKPAPVSRFTILYGENEQLTSVIRPGVVISPDGLRIAYLANRQLRVREINAFDARTLPTSTVQLSNGAPINPTFSPDGTEMAYYETADSTIKRISLSGAGSPSTVCPTTEISNGLSWYGDFVYTTTTSGIMRCPVTGGQETLVIKAEGNAMMTRPQVLSDGHLLFAVSKPTTLTTDRWADAEVVVQRPGDASPTLLFKGGNDPRVVPSGHIVYVSGGILYARRFDLAHLTAGPAFPMIEGIVRSAGGIGSGTWWYGVSDTGTLVYQPGPVGASGAQKMSIAIFDRAGKAEALKIPPGPYGDPRLSPDGKWLAFDVDDGRDISISIFDMSGSGSPSRLTFGGHDRSPVWSSDGKQVIFQSDRGGDLGLYMQPADGSGTAVRLTKPGPQFAHVPQSTSPDGEVLLFDEVQDTRTNRVALMIYSFRDKTIKPFADLTSIWSTGAMFSPNGRWVSYAQRNPGTPRSTTYVQPYPPTGVQRQVSPVNEDGHHQVWSRDGKELLYTPGPGTVFDEVAVTLTPASISFGPGGSFARSFVNLPPSYERPFDISRNAKGEPVIIGLTPSIGDLSRPVRIENRVVLNWFEELKARVK